MTLDLSSLQKTIEALDNSINSYLSNENNVSLTDNDRETLKSGVIQNFEVSFELCWKFMKRWLEINSGGQVVDGLTIKELFRIASERQLIPNVESWFAYHKARNLTSHTYDINNADAAYEAAKKFISDAKALLKVLEEKND